MATHISDQVKALNEFKSFPNGTVGIRYGAFTLSGATTPVTLDNGDLISMFRAYKGETIVGCYAYADAVDAGSALEWNVGYNADAVLVGGAQAAKTSTANATAIFSALTIGRTAGGTDTFQAAFTPINLAADAMIQIEIGTKSGTQAAGSFKLWLMVA